MIDDAEGTRIRELLRAELAAITPVLKSDVLEAHVLKVANLAGAYASNVLGRKRIEEAERKVWMLSDLYRLYDALADYKQAMGRIDGAILRIGASIDPQPEEDAQP